MSKPRVRVSVFAIGGMRGWRWTRQDMMPVWCVFADWLPLEDRRKQVESAFKHSWMCR